MSGGTLALIVTGLRYVAIPLAVVLCWRATLAAGRVIAGQPRDAIEPNRAGLGLLTLGIGLFQVRSLYLLPVQRFDYWSAYALTSMLLGMTFFVARAHHDDTLGRRRIVAAVLLTMLAGGLGLGILSADAGPLHFAAQTVTRAAPPRSTLDAALTVIGSSEAALLYGCTTLDARVAVAQLLWSLLTAVSYFAIGGALAVIARRFAWLGFRGALILYGLFIFLCGAEHLTMAGRMLWPGSLPALQADLAAGAARAAVSVLAAIVTLGALSAVLRSADFLNRLATALRVIERGRLSVSPETWEAAVDRLQVRG